MLHETHIASLNLSANLLGPKSLASLADALRVNTRLEALDLSGAPCYLVITPLGGAGEPSASPRLLRTQRAPLASALSQTTSSAALVSAGRRLFP